MMRTPNRFLGLSVALVALVAGLTPAFAGKPGGGGTTPPPLPPVRYYTTFVSMPAGSTGCFPNAMNNRAQYVGWFYGDTIPQSGFLFDPASPSSQAININSLVTAGLAPGERIRSCVAINDWGVVVGALEDSAGVVRAFAMDVEADYPVVDLLPDFGYSFSAGWAINENGDIVGYLKDAQGAIQYYSFNAGHYGAWGDRLPREAGVPLDFSQDLPPTLFTSSTSPVLNNPAGGQAAQIAGTVAGTSSPFRYTLGASSSEVFPELSVPYGVRGLNDFGTFCGRATIPVKKGQTQTVPFRFNNSVDGPDTLPASLGSATNINSSNDITLYSKKLYRDDWGVVSLDDLVVGPDAASFRASTTDVIFMSDRAGAIDAAQLIKHAVNGAYLLTPISIP